MGSDESADSGGAGSERRVRSSWRLLIMDRDRATCEALSGMLSRAPDFEVVGQALNTEQARRRLETREADFVLANAHLPAEEILGLCRSIGRTPAGKPPRIVITGVPADAALLVRYVEAGAVAFTPEELSVEGLRVTLRLLARGQAVFPLQLQYLLAARLSELAAALRDRGLDPETLWNLTSREGEILLLLEEGLTNHQIATRLYISEGTVKSHVHEILKKLDVRSRSEAVKLLHYHRAAPGRLVLGEDGFRREP